MGWSNLPLALALTASVPVLVLGLVAFNALRGTEPYQRAEILKALAVFARAVLVRKPGLTLPQVHRLPERRSIERAAVGQKKADKSLKSAGCHRSLSTRGDLDEEAPSG